jgi:hypothetical protein
MIPRVSVSLIMCTGDAWRRHPLTLDCDGRHNLGHGESGRVMVFSEEKTMSNCRINPESRAIELNDEQLGSVTGGRKGGDDRVYLVVTMKEVLISSVPHGSSQD